MGDRELRPGWWQATDGEWYPPRWEYRWAVGHLHAKPHLEDIETVVSELGLQGWEAVDMVRSQITTSNEVTVLMKRPVYK